MIVEVKATEHSGELAEAEIEQRLAWKLGFVEGAPIVTSSTRRISAEIRSRCATRATALLALRAPLKPER